MEALKKAFAIRKDYAYLGIMENNDTIQQTMHLAGQLMAIRDYDNAFDILTFCENIISELMGTANLDYGICRLYQGILLYQRTDFNSAESLLLEAHSLFKQLLRESLEHGYIKTSRKYLYSLYMRTGKRELAEKYKQRKLLVGTK